MQKHFISNSNFQEQNNLSSHKKKFTTPALLFCKSQKDSHSKTMSQNNSSFLNITKSPNGLSNSKNDSLISKNPLINKSNSIQNKSIRQSLFTKSRKTDNYSQDGSIKQSLHFCQNHQNRTASYISNVDESQKQYFCQKCAILYASQGYKVQKIQDYEGLIQSRKIQIDFNNLSRSKMSQKSSRLSQRNMLENSSGLYLSQNNRKIEIDSFLNLSRNLLGDIELKKEEIRQNLIQSQQFYGQQIEQVNEYFDLVYKSLELQKNKCYNYILNQRVEVEQPIRLINEAICELRQKVEGIIEDIEENIETVYQTTNQIYRPVIQQYQDNYEQIQRKLGQIQVLGVQMRKVDFEGVPESIFSLSDILKNSIDQNNHQENQKKMNEQLNSLRQSLRQSLSQIQPRKLFSKRNQVSQESEKKNKNKFCFSFQGEALQAQLQQEDIIYQVEE